MRPTGKRNSLPVTGSDGTGPMSIAYLALRRSTVICFLSQRDCSESTAGAAAIVHDHLLCEPLAELQGYNPADDVGRASPREADDEGDRVVGGIRLRDRQDRGKEDS